MIYHLFDYLMRQGIALPFSRLFTYVSFRVGMAVILALLISTIWGGRIIHFLQRKQIGELVRDLGLEGEQTKKGTPTMGGIIIIMAILIPTLLFARLDNIYILLMIVTTVLMGLLGFADDYIKVFKKDKEGLHGRFKIIAQVGLGLIVGLTLYFSPDVVIRENMEIRRAGQDTIEEVRIHPSEVKSTKTTIPFVKNNNFDYSVLAAWAGRYKTEVTWLLFVLMTIFVVTAVSNGTNLTDGLDGLAAGSSAIVGIALGVLAYTSSHFEFASFPAPRSWWSSPRPLLAPRSASCGTTPIPRKSSWATRAA